MSRVITVTEAGSHISAPRYDSEAKTTYYSANGAVKHHPEPRAVYIQGGSKRLVKV